MNIAFDTHRDGQCVINHAEGLDVTAEEIESAYTVIKNEVEADVSVAPAGIINPEDVHALTLQHIAYTFTTVRHEDVRELGSVVDVPVSVDLEPVFKQTFCDALSTLGKWNIQERPDSQTQQHQAEESFQTHNLDSV